MERNERFAICYPPYKMKKVSIPVNKISPQDINLAKSSKAMADVEAILKLSSEERSARLSEVSQKIAQGSATLYEEKVLTRLLSPGQAEWIKLIYTNLPDLEVRLKHLAEKEKSSPLESTSGSDLSFYTVQAIDSPDQTTGALLSSRSLEKERKLSGSTSPPSNISPYFKGFLTGILVLGVIGAGIWSTYKPQEKSKPEAPAMSQQTNTSSIPSDTLQVVQTKLDKGRHEIRIGNFTKGESELKEITLKYPETPHAEEAYLILAEAHRHRNQRPDKALQIYQAFLEKYPSSFQIGLVLLKMGFCYEDMEDKGNAVAMYRLVLQRNGEKSRIGQLAAERLKTLTKE